MRQRLIQLALVTTISLFLAACGKQRSEDVEAIKKSYAEFRMALLKHDFHEATNYVSSDLLARHPNPEQMLIDFSRGFTNAEMRMELTGDAWVRFQHQDHAFLFPRRPPTVGQGFVRETNGWKITVSVLPIMD